jgi:hypothetical protein
VRVISKDTPFPHPFHHASGDHRRPPASLTKLEGVPEIHFVVGNVGKVNQVVKRLEAGLFPLLVGLKKLSGVSRRRTRQCG